MVFDNIYFQILVYSSLILFNTLMVLALFAVLFFINTTQSIRIKTELTIAKIYDGATNVGEMGLNIASFVSQFNIFQPKRRKIGDILRKFM